MDNITADLNPAQLEAVTAPMGNQLILAGAGSGKTRVLVHRIAWLIEQENLSPYSIVAVTFTNKAAKEIRLRVEQLLNAPTSGMWLGTFHSIAHRLLRMHWEEAGLPENFQILDSDDQQRLLRRILDELGLDRDRWPLKMVQWFINNKKDDGIRANKIQHFDNITDRTLVNIYSAYEAACQRGGMVDFAELLLRCHELWQNNPDLLAHYQQRFQYLLIDEFQDTNSVQYAWLKLLAGNTTPVMAVGDDDQSIYGWRGAKIENIREFTQYFKNTHITRLEQNYRSTGNILAAANQVIQQNQDRLGKELWTESGEGEKIATYAGYNDLDEARFIVNQIQRWFQSGNPYNDVAVLYRSNAQSRVLEESLMQQGVPYRVYGGLRFFDRAEIKDALAYLRLISNRDDDPAFERSINQPPRGIGEKSVQTIRDFARESDMSLWESANHLCKAKGLRPQAMKSIEGFISLIERIDSDTKNVALHELAEHCLIHSGLIPHYEKERGEKAQARLENLEELVSACRQFDTEDLTAPSMHPLTDFLSHAVLESGENQAEEFTDSVQLMTLHSAKGLEFPLVFMAGMEEGLFPHKMSQDEPGRLDEERRLCYVGMTRAMGKLVMTYAEKRRIYGKEVFYRPSRFLSDIPEELLAPVRPTRQVSRPMTYSPKSRISQPTRNESGLMLSQRVTHPKFGDGVIVSFEGQGAQARVQVKFNQAGTKWLVAAYAKLEPSC